MLSRSNDLFLEQLAVTATTVDRTFAVVLAIEWLVGVALALVISPLAWEGAKSAIHVHVWAALLLGGVVALPPELRREAFFHCWTRKEAYIKAIGKGLYLGLDQFDVSLRPGEPAALLATQHDPNEARRWSMRSLVPNEGYVGALVVEGHSWRLWCGDWIA